MSLRGVPQCQKVTLYYNEAWGDAAGIKEFIRSLLPLFRQSAPWVQIEAVNRPGQVAHVAATYANGRGKKICVRRNNAEEILRHIENLSTCSGIKFDRWNRIKSYVVHTHRKSVQGQWTVWTFENTGKGAKGSNSNSSNSSSARPTAAAMGGSAAKATAGRGFASSSLDLAATDPIVKSS